MKAKNTTNTAYNALHSDYRYYNHLTPGSFTKVYNAIIVDKETNKKHYFKSVKGRIFFERKCDLTNALNYAFGTDNKWDWVTKYPGEIIIEERWI
jgi:hypothetical protein